MMASTSFAVRPAPSAARLCAKPRFVLARAGKDDLGDSVQKNIDLTASKAQEFADKTAGQGPTFTDDAKRSLAPRVEELRETQLTDGLKSRESALPPRCLPCHPSPAHLPAAADPPRARQRSSASSARCQSC